MKNSFFALLSRMSYITRWGLMRNTRTENLSEHTLQTAFIAHALCVIKNKRLGSKVDAAKAVMYALYHDATEIVTGDLPTPVKYYNSEIKQVYKKVEDEAANRMLSRIPEDIREEFKPYLYASDDDEIAAIVKGADVVSAYIKCVQETDAGNKDFAHALVNTEKKIKALNMPEVDIFIKEFLPAYSFTIDELNQL